MTWLVISVVVDGVVFVGLLANTPAGAPPFVDTDDIADAAAAALRAGDHVGHLYVLSGPTALTFEDAVADISAALDREIRLEPVPVGPWTENLRGAGVPAEVIELLQYLFTEVLDGRNNAVAGVHAATGRSPRSFTELARHAAVNGAWTS